MRYWFDTEFIEDGKTIDLVSIGIVAEDGRMLYFQNQEADLSRASEWVKENVIAHLEDCECSDRRVVPIAENRHRGRCSWETRKAIAKELLEFCHEIYGAPEFWGYYADYDWVVLCQLFGTMMDLPKGWPMYCRDIKQWCDMLGNPKLPEQGKGEHHALADAKWNKAAWEFLSEGSRVKA